MTILKNTHIPASVSVGNSPCVRHISLLPAGLKAALDSPCLAKTASGRSAEFDEAKTDVRFSEHVFSIKLVI